MANTENSIRHQLYFKGLGSDALRGGESITKLGDPSNQFHLKYSISNIAKNKRPNNNFIFETKTILYVIHTGGQLVAIVAHHLNSLGVGHLLLKLCGAGDLGENTFRHDIFQT